MENKWIKVGAWVIGIVLAIFLICKIAMPFVPKEPVFHESLTVKEIKENLPKHGYVLDRWDYKISEEGYHDSFYEPDCNPFCIKSASISIVSSGLEDGMIYTLSQEMEEGGTIIERLYINDPYTLELVAMGETIKDEDRDLYLLYTFLDKKAYTWYDKNTPTPQECE